MRAFAYLSQGQAGWVEKAPPQATGFDGIIRPCWSPLPLMSTMESRLSGPPTASLGHEGLGEIVAVGTRCVTSRWERSWWCPCDPRLADRPSQLGAHQHCAGLITGQKLSNGETVFWPSTSASVT